MQHDPKMVEMVARAMFERNGMRWEHIIKHYRDDALLAATAALDALAAAGRLVPEGWVAVKRDVLGSLCDDAEALLRQNCGEPPHPALARRYERDVVEIREARAMLAAAPRAEDQA